MRRQRPQPAPGWRSRRQASTPAWPAGLSGGWAGVMICPPAVFGRALVSAAICCWRVLSWAWAALSAAWSPIRAGEFDGSLLIWVLRVAMVFLLSASGDRLLCSICPAILATLTDRTACGSPYGSEIRTGSKIMAPLGQRRDADGRGRGVDPGHRRDVHRRGEHAEGGQVKDDPPTAAHHFQAAPRLG